MATICSCINTFILQSNHFLLAENLHICFLNTVCFYFKLSQRNYTTDVKTKGHIRGQKQSLQLLTKIKSGMFVQNPEAHWLTLTILVYIHTDLSLLFLTPTCQNTCNSKRTQYTEALKYSSLRFSCLSEIVSQARTKIRTYCQKKIPTQCASFRETYIIIITAQNPVNPD